MPATPGDTKHYMPRLGFRHIRRNRHMLHFSSDGPYLTSVFPFYLSIIFNDLSLSLISPFFGTEGG